MGAAAGSYTEETRNEAMELGKNLVKICRNKAIIPEIESAQNEFKQRMQMLMLYRKDEWPYEWEYWRKNRGLT